MGHHLRAGPEREENSNNNKYIQLEQNSVLLYNMKVPTQSGGLEQSENEWH